MKTWNKFLRICLLCLLCGSLLSAVAYADDWRENGTGNLTVSYAPEDEPAVGATFRLYKVATLENGTCWVTDSKYDECDHIEELAESDPDYPTLAASLADYVEEGSIAYQYSGITKLDGTATFEGIPQGLYLITGEETQGDGSKSYHHYQPVPTLVSIPSAVYDDQGNAIPGEYSYDVHMEAKPNISAWDHIEVQLDWSDIATNDHAGNAITVTLQRNGEPYEAAGEVVTGELNKENSFRWQYDAQDPSEDWDILVGDFPTGYTVTQSDNGWQFLIQADVTTSAQKKLPQSGLVWWPVPALLFASALCAMLGLSARKEKKSAG